MNYDIAIVGLGPAGATLARLLSDRFNVIAIDKKSAGISSSFSKCCGGLLSDDAQKSLARQNLALPKEILVNPQIFSVRTIDPNIEEERYYQRFYLNMNRHAFDMWLISLIPERVKILENSHCSEVRKIPTGGFELIVRSGAELQTISTKIVIGADGAGSIVRQKLGGTTAIEYVAIQEWYHVPNQQPFYVSLFDQKITDSYCWALSKDDHLIVGAAVPPDHALERFEQFKDHMIQRGFKLENKVKREGCKVLLADSFGDQDLGREGSYFIGEAAGFISPSSLEGISYAMDSAVVLAKVLNESTQEITKRYKKTSFALRMKIHSRIVKRFFIYQPLLRKWIMKSGIQSIKVEIKP